MKEQFLLTPGPSPVPEDVRLVLGKSMIHHRTDEFQAVLKDVHQGLKYVYQTANPVLVFASSGTGAMEAGIVNFFSPQDTVIVVEAGKFGERWVEIAQAYQLKVVTIKVEWGQPFNTEVLRKTLKENPAAKGVFATLCETSTATVYDIEAIAGVVKENTNLILVVDAISGLGQDVLKTDAWGVDVVVSGSQKGLMLPPGLAFISVSQKAMSLMGSAKLPRYYLDIKKAHDAFLKDDTPFTPAVSLVRGLQVSLDMIKQQTIEKRWELYGKMAQALREAFKAIGLESFSKSPSRSVTALLCNFDSGLLLKKLRKEKSLSIAEGQGHLKGKIFRVAHMGCISEQDMVKGLSLIEAGLREVGYKDFKVGESLKRFQEVFHG